MSEEILNNNTQNKFTNLIKKNSKNLIIFLIIIILSLFGYFFYNDLKKKNEIKISEKYTKATIQFKEKETDEAKQLLENIIDKDHRFYSPLALYFIIDNNLETNSSKIINFYDDVLSINSIDKEDLNLIKIKKAIFLFNLEEEEDSIIKTLNPIINSDSIWRDMAIKLISDYFLSKNQKTKADEYIKLLNKKIKK
jgi:predicted negative regulator of RcsB-dependent stress response